MAPSIFHQESNLIKPSRAAGPGCRPQTSRCAQGPAGLVAGMAGGRGAAPCGAPCGTAGGCAGPGCGGAGAGAGPGAAGRAWLPRARWLARRLAALLVLLALLAAGCLLHRRACPAPRPRRNGPPRPRQHGPAAPQGELREERVVEMGLPPLPSYEKVKHLPSYEEAQRCPSRPARDGDGEGWVCGWAATYGRDAAIPAVLASPGEVLDAMRDKMGYWTWWDTGHNGMPDAMGCCVLVVPRRDAMLDTEGPRRSRTQEKSPLQGTRHSPGTTTGGYQAHITPSPRPAAPELLLTSLLWAGQEKGWVAQGSFAVAAPCRQRILSEQDEQRASTDEGGSQGQRVHWKKLTLGHHLLHDDIIKVQWREGKGCLHLSLHPDHNVISTTPRAQPARAIIPQGWEQEAGAAGAYSSHNPQHLYRAFHFSSRQTEESNLHCLLIKCWHPLAPCSLFSWGSWDWGEAFFVFFRGQAGQKSVQSPKEREAVKKNLFTQISTGPMWAL